LAKYWTLIDERTWEFKLRPGVLFHDGKPRTAEDVALSIARIPTPLHNQMTIAAARKGIDFTPRMDDQLVATYASAVIRLEHDPIR
jgi:peptide/nickel transport system substrate-binding protein